MSPYSNDGLSIRYPIDPKFLLRKKKSIKRALIARGGQVEKRIAILGGSTTAEIGEMLELFLLDRGIRPIFYESEYNKYYEDVMFCNEALLAFAPDLIFVHTTNVNIRQYPSHGNPAKNLLETELNHFCAMWDEIRVRYNCPIIQNNFDPPRHRPLGNLEAYDSHGICLFINQLNQRFADEAQTRDYLYLHDINWLAASLGLTAWRDLNVWYGYKYAIGFDAIPAYSNSVASIIGSIFGMARKCLILDLDNTLWGGVIGDDGVGGIQIGHETPEGEAHRDLQTYARNLKERGVILAIASKNNPESALEGLSHPDNVLRTEDFSVIKANWDPKHENVGKIAEELNIGTDALLFIDDNAAERDIVASNLPTVCVPNVGSDIANFVTVLDSTGHFEPVSISLEDRKRSQLYAENAERVSHAAKYADYNEFLKSLEMIADISGFRTAYLDRVSQLTNKSNQFNLTTRRYSTAEIQAMAVKATWITLQASLTDKYGDNGIVSVVAGEVVRETLRVDLWLMSCRVLKRNLEFALLEALVKEAVSRGVATIIGEYIPTAKNSMVRQFYADLGFTPLDFADNGSSRWILKVEHYRPIDYFIEIRNEY